MSIFNDDVKAELDALVSCGIEVHPRVYVAAQGDLAGYENMGVSNCADLLIDLNEIGE